MCGKKSNKNWCWREKKEYLVGLGIGRILLNALVYFTVGSDLPKSSRCKLELMHAVSTCALIFLNLYMIR
jgi:hypothetical protein